MPVLGIPPRPHGAAPDSPEMLGWLDLLWRGIAYGEQGAWTPSDGSGAALTLTGVVGTYTKFGNIVIAKAKFTYPITADGSSAVIAGLPYSTLASNNLSGGNLVYTTSAVANKIFATQGAATFSIWTAAGVAVTNAQMSATANWVELIYAVS